MAIMPEDGAAVPIRTALAACRRHFAHAAIFSAFLNLLYLAPTIYMLQVYDRVVPTRGTTSLAVLTGVFVAAVAAIALLDLIRTRLLIRAGTRLDALLCADILEALLHTSVGTGGARTSAVLREFDLFRQTMTGTGVLALFDIPWTPIYILVCFLIHPALAGLALAGAILLATLSWSNERATSAPVKDALAQGQHFYAGVDVSLASAGVISALGMGEAVQRRHLRERRRSTVLVTRTSFSTAGFTALVKALRLLLQSLALGLGALLAIEQRISIGAIFAASLLVSRALQPIELVNGAWKNLIQSRAAYRQLVDLFARRGPERRLTALPAPRGGLAVEQLGVVAPDGQRPLISDISFVLAPGEMLGVIGPSGAGKSTLARAIVGALPAAQGSIRIDGSDRRNWPADQLGAAIGYVPQEPVLLRATIKENIARLRTELVAAGSLDEAVVRAAQAGGAHDFIVRLPQGYDTQLGWSGSGLSVGQSQRVALARALFGQPALIVLDEPNAALDAEGEASLVKALDDLRQSGTTLVVVAHRSGILRGADKLLVLRDGRAEMFGPQQEVLAGLRARAKSPAPAAGEAAAAEDRAGSPVAAVSQQASR